MWIVAIVGLGWTVSLCLHEFGHAIVAYWGGDKSVKDKGYLTLNPLKYTDPTLSLMLPLLFLLLGGIALPGGAVYINRGKLRSRFWESAVSAAGPLANAFVAICLAGFFQQAGAGSPDWLWPGLAFLVLLQISAVFLNLIPIPPLDGYGIIEPWLPRAAQRQLQQVSRYGIWIIFALFWFVPAFSAFFWGATSSVSLQLGVPLNLAWQGFETFRSNSVWLIVGLVVVFWLFRNREQGLYQKGNQHLRSRRYEPALKAFDQAVERRPDYYEAWYGRGNALAGLHRYEEAFASYNKAIQIQPDAPAVWFNRGLVLLEQQQLDAAAKSFANAAERAPDDQLAAYGWAYRGQALQQMGELEAALESYQQAGDRDRQFQPIWLWQADVLEQLERDEDALAALARALECKDRQPELWTRRGELLNRLGRPEAAFSDCEQAIVLNPNLAAAWVARGVALEQLARPQEALDSYAQAIAVQSDCAEAWYRRAVVSAQQGDREAALTALEQALAIAPDTAARARTERAFAVLHEDPRWAALWN